MLCKGGETSGATSGYTLSECIKVDAPLDHESSVTVELHSIVEHANTHLPILRSVTKH
jgi:hypothetical protein